MKKILLLLFSALIVSSCEVEFSPNAEWKDVPVVYCILDQDDSLSWVRVERCYLGEGNVASYASVRDSLIYPQGSIHVYLLAHQDGNLKDSIPFTYTTTERDAGTFASSSMPLYYAVTQNRLRQDWKYSLYVRKSDGSVLVSTDSIGLIKFIGTSSKPSPITAPSYNAIMDFGGFNFDVTGKCEIKWDTLTNARLFRPSVRFYYRYENGDTSFVDLPCPSATQNSNSNALSVQYESSSLLRDLAVLLKDDTRSKTMLFTVDVYLYCCTEDFNIYLNSVSQTSLGTTGDAVYNNIHGGLGLFAARRTHLYKNLPFEHYRGGLSVSDVVDRIRALPINMH